MRTSTTWLTLGRMCLNMRLMLLAPMASAERTYSRLRCLMNSARTWRYMPVQPVSARMMTTLPTPRPTTAAKAKMSRMFGMLSKTL